MNFNLTLLGQSIAFALFVLFCMRYVWPPIVNAMRERQQAIQDSLSDADAARDRLKEVELEIAAKREETRQRMAEILQDANLRAQQIIEKTKEKAIEEEQRIKEAYQAEFEQEVNRTKEALRKELGALVVAGVKQVTQQKIDPKAHKKLIDELASNL